MSDQPETYQRVSVPEAAGILGVSVATVRRRIRDGSLRAEPVHRPQGIAYVVLLSNDHATDHERSDSDQQVGTTARLNQSQVPPAEAIAAMIQATLTPIIAPLVGELAASRQANARQAEQLVSAAETIGRQSAELERARAEIDALTSSAASETAQSTPRAPGTFLRAWARLDWLIVALVAAVVVAGVLLVWPR